MLYWKLLYSFVLYFWSYSFYLREMNCLLGFFLEEKKLSMSFFHRWDTGLRHWLRFCDGINYGTVQASRQLVFPVIVSLQSISHLHKIPVENTTRNSCLGVVLKLRQWWRLILCKKRGNSNSLHHPTIKSTQKHNKLKLLKFYGTLKRR